MMIITEHVEPHLLGGLAETVGGDQRVQAGVRTLALLDQQCAAVVRHHLVDVLVILNLHLVVGLVGRSLVPGECGEWTAPDLGNDADVAALLGLHELLQLNGRRAWRNTRVTFSKLEKLVGQ